MLKCVFPQQFSVDLDEEVVRTPQATSFFNISVCYLKVYEGLKTKNETSFATCPALGERPDSNRRPSEPQTDALTN